MKNLDKLRKDINKIDQQLLSLLSKRIKLVQKVGVCKKEKGLPIKDSAREAEILKRISLQGIELDISPPLVKKIWKAIFSESYKIER